MKAYREVVDQLHCFLTWTDLPPGKDSGSWVSPTDGMDDFWRRKTLSYLCEDSNSGPYTPQPFHYTDYVIQHPVSAQIGLNYIHRSVFFLPSILY